MLEHWVNMWRRLEDLVVVADNAPCHFKLKDVFLINEANFLRLGPYSPMLNPVETTYGPK